MSYTDPGKDTKRDVTAEEIKIKTGKSSALSSKRSLFFHDVPPELYRRTAKRYTDGHIKYSPNITMNLNWRVGLNDPFYVMDRLNHMFDHMIDFLEHGNSKDDNLGAIAWCCGFLMEVERVSPNTLKEILGQANLVGDNAKDYKTFLEGVQDTNANSNAKSVPCCADHLGS